MSTPVLDTTQPYSTIYGSGAANEPATRYIQDGHHFGADNAYLKSESNAAAKAAPIAVAPVEPAKKIEKQTLPGVSEEETAELLKDPRADELLAMPRDKIMALVDAAGGPLVAGPGSHGNMVAFLIKHTRPDSDEL